MRYYCAMPAGFLSRDFSIECNVDDGVAAQDVDNYGYNYVHNELISCGKKLWTDGMDSRDNGGVGCAHVFVIRMYDKSICNNMTTIFF